MTRHQPLSTGTPHDHTPPLSAPPSLFIRSPHLGRVLCGHTLPGVRPAVAVFPTFQAPVAGCRPHHEYVCKCASHARNAGIPSSLHVRTGDRPVGFRSMHVNKRSVAGSCLTPALIPADACLQIDQLTVRDSVGRTGDPKRNDRKWLSGIRQLDDLIIV